MWYARARLYTSPDLGADSAVSSAHAAADICALVAVLTAASESGSLSHLASSLAAMRRLLLVLSEAPKIGTLLRLPGNASAPLCSALFDRAGGWVARILRSVALPSTARCQAASALATLLRLTREGVGGANSGDNSIDHCAALLAPGGGASLDALASLILDAEDDPAVRVAAGDVLVEAARAHGSGSPYTAAASLLLACQAADITGFRTLWRVARELPPPPCSPFMIAAGALAARLRAAREAAFAAASKAIGEAIESAEGAPVFLQGGIPGCLVAVVAHETGFSGPVSYLPATALDAACLCAVEEELLAERLAPASLGLGENLLPLPQLLSLVLPCLHALDSFSVADKAATSTHMLPASPTTRDGVPLERSDTWLRVAAALIDEANAAADPEAMPATVELWAKLLAFPTVATLQIAAASAPRVDARTFRSALLPRTRLLLASSNGSSSSISNTMDMPPSEPVLALLCHAARCLTQSDVGSLLSADDAGADDEVLAQLRDDLSAAFLRSRTSLADGPWPERLRSALTDIDSARQLRTQGAVWTASAGIDEETDTQFQPL